MSNKMYLKQHIPNATFDPRSDKKKTWEFSNMDQLMDLDIVKHYKNPRFQNFHRLSLNHPAEWQVKQAGKHIYILMQETEDGFSWSVIGFLHNVTEDILDSFPKWESKYREGNKKSNKEYKPIISHIEEKAMKSLRNEFEMNLIYGDNYKDIK